MKKGEALKLLKDKLFLAFMIAPALAMVLFSAGFYLLSTSLGQSPSGVPQVVLSCLTLLTLAGSTTLAVIYKKSFVTSFLSIIFLLCLVCYSAILISNSTNLFDDSFFEAVMLALSLPVSSYRALAIGAFGTGADVACCIITAVIAVVNTALGIYISKTKDRGEE